MKTIKVEAKLYKSRKWITLKDNVDYTFNGTTITFSKDFPMMKAQIKTSYEYENESPVITKCDWTKIKNPYK